MRRVIAAFALGVPLLGATASAAPEQLSVDVRPVLVGPRQAVTVSGALANGKDGELIVIEAKDCGQTFFRDVASATTRDGGAWSTEFVPGINTILRAVWGGMRSRQISIRQRASVSLSPRASPRKYYVAVGGKAQFWRKRVLIQRFDRRLGKWVTLRSVQLTETGGYPGSGEVVSWAEFKASFPKRSQIRALFPRAEARPCYLGGVSKLLGT